MKRRGFLGFLAGGAVAGPGLAKQAVEGLADLSIPTGVEQLGRQASLIGEAKLSDLPWNAKDHAVRNLARIAGISQERHAFEIRRAHVGALDPDLASYRSLSLGTKIRMQQERNYWRDLDRERSWLEATIAGLFDTDDQGPDW